MISLALHILAGVVGTLLVVGFICSLPHLIALFVIVIGGRRG